MDNRTLINFRATPDDMALLGRAIDALASDRPQRVSRADAIRIGLSLVVDKYAVREIQKRPEKSSRKT